MLFAFAGQAQKFSAVDFMLTAVLKKYAANALLLTNNHHDFTSGLFTLITLLPLTPARGSIIPFGLYAFSEGNYAQLLAANTRQS